MRLVLVMLTSLLAGQVGLCANRLQGGLSGDVSLSCSGSKKQSKSEVKLELRDI